MEENLQFSITGSHAGIVQQKLKDKSSYLKGSAIMNDFMGNWIIDVLMQWHNHILLIICINLLATMHFVNPGTSLEITIDVALIEGIL